MICSSETLSLLEALAICNFSSTSTKRVLEHNLYCPVSNSKGETRIVYDVLDSASSLFIIFKIWGCNNFSNQSFSSSLSNMASRSFCLSKLPSFKIISDPKWSSISFKLEDPFYTAFLEAISASITSIFNSEKISVTAVLPEPMPPVIPKTNILVKC